MAVLHEHLAVMPTIEGAAREIAQETEHVFKQKKHHFLGQIKMVHPVQEDSEPEEDLNSRVELTTTVPEKLKGATKTLSKYIDSILVRDATNQSASADVIVDGKPLIENVPATALLSLEQLFRSWRKIFECIPTLQPGIDWSRDEDHEKGHVFKRVIPQVNIKTRKEETPLVLYEATKDHPAQVEVRSSDVKVADILTDVWSGQISPREKSEILTRYDKILRAIKKARARANDTELDIREAGKSLFSYIVG